MLATWLLWELGVLAASLRLARRLDCVDEAPGDQALAAVLAIDITLTSLLAGAFAFLHVNGAAAYLIATAVLLVYGLPGCRVPALFRSASWSEHPHLFALLGAAFAPLLARAFRPVEEVDSLNYAYYLLEWLGNRLNPYTFVTNYVPFWELTFLPAMTLARTDTVFAVLALKSWVLLGAALLVGARGLGIDARVALVIVSGTLAFRQCWWPNSGVSTLKNDMLYGAGTVLMTTALIGAWRGHRGAVAMALGAAFALVKFSGMAMAAPLIALWWWLERPRVRTVAVVAGFAFVCSGHYYLRNLIAWGNPLYPFTVRVLGFELPGKGDLSGTSILAHLHDGAMWRLLFAPEGGISPAGLLFPVVLAVTPLVALVLLARAALRREKPDAWARVGMVVLCGWYLYFRSFYSAGATPEDLTFLRASLASLRYVDGIIGLSELLLLGLTARFIGMWPAVAIAALGLLSRVWLMAPSRSVIAPLVAFALLFAMGVLARRTGRAWLVPALCVLLAIPLCTALTTRHRAEWLPAWRPLYRALEAAPPGDVLLIEDDKAGYFAGALPLAGNGFARRVRVATTVGNERFLVRWVNPGEKLPAFDAPGYAPIARTPLGVLWERAMPEPLTDGVKAVRLKAGERRPTDGRVIVDDSTGTVFRTDARATHVLVPAEGAHLVVDDATYTFRAGVWEAVPPVRLWLNPDAHLTEAAEAKALRWGFVSISGGNYKLEFLSDDDGPFVRLHALNDANWLVLAGAYPSEAGAGPLTIRARLRCPAEGCSLQHRGAEELRRDARTPGQWETLDLLVNRSQALPRDYFAAGLGPVRAGAFFDIREFGLLRGAWSALGSR